MCLGTLCAVGPGLWLAPRHCWLGLWGVRGCARPLPYPATPGSGVRCGCVCFHPGFCCAPPLLAGVLGCVFVCVCAPFVARNSWLGCAVWAFLLWLALQLRPATPGWGVGVCVCVCLLRPACSPPLLAGMCGVGVCGWARVRAAPRHFLLGCWGMFVFVCALRLSPAGPGWDVQCWCVCFGLRFHLRHATLGWGVGVSVCFCAGSACTPPLLAGMCGVGLCVWVRLSPAPRHSWLACWGECVFVCGLRFYPATPG